MNCRKCGNPLIALIYAQYGYKNLVDGHWVEDESQGTLYFECADCGQELEFEQMQALGLF